MTTKRLPTALRPKGLGPRGSALWKALTADEAPSAERAVLIAEACRLSDRLEKYDALLRGDIDTWLTFDLPPDEIEVVVKVDGAANAALRTAAELRQLVRQITEGATEKQSGGSIADELKKRRDLRAAGAEG